MLGKMLNIIFQSKNIYFGVQHSTKGRRKRLLCKTFTKYVIKYILLLRQMNELFQSVILCVCVCVMVNWNNKIEIRKKGLINNTHVQPTRPTRPMRPTRLTTSTHDTRRQITQSTLIVCISANRGSSRVLCRAGSVPGSCDLCIPITFGQYYTNVSR